MGWFDRTPSVSSRHPGASTRAHTSHRAPSSNHSSYSRSSSYYKRRPRDGYINRLIYKLKHLIGQLWYYARKNPIKVVLLLMPFAGVIAGVARQFGIKLPDFMGQNAKGGRGGGGGGYYGSQGYGGRDEGGMGGLGGLASGGNLGSLMNIAKAFM